MSRTNKKELEKRMLVKRTIAEMDKQIRKLEESKKVYIEQGRIAKQKGLTAQYNLALSGLKMTIIQQRRVYEMKLNFEITAQMRDMSKMTSEFLKGLGSLSKDMMRLTKEKDFLKVQNQFNEAMVSVEAQTENMEAFMEDTQSMFAAGTTTNEETSNELDALMTNEASLDEMTDSEIERELEMLKKKMS